MRLTGVIGIWMVRERVQKLPSTFNLKLTAAALSSLKTDDDAAAALPSMSANNLRIEARSRPRYLRNARSVALFQVPVLYVCVQACNCHSDSEERT